MLAGWARRIPPIQPCYSWKLKLEPEWELDRQRRESFIDWAMRRRRRPLPVSLLEEYGRYIDRMTRCGFNAFLPLMYVSLGDLIAELVRRRALPEHVSAITNGLSTARDCYGKAIY